jgi:hypothetical protein
MELGLQFAFFISENTQNTSAALHLHHKKYTLQQRTKNRIFLHHDRP